MFLRVLSRLEESFLSFLLIGMVLLVFIEVVLRFGFNTGFLWMQELTLHISAWFVLFGASYGVKVGAHIGVDAFIKTLTLNSQRMLSIVVVILCLIYCALFLIGGWFYLSKVYEIGISLEDIRIPNVLLYFFSEELAQETLRINNDDPLIPLWFAHAPIVIGFILLAIRFIELSKQLITGETKGLHQADEIHSILEKYKKKSQVIHKDTKKTSP